jgi:hypothetical protein
VGPVLGLTTPWWALCACGVALELLACLLPPPPCRRPRSTAVWTTEKPPRQRCLTLPPCQGRFEAAARAARGGRRTLRRRVLAGWGESGTGRATCCPPCPENTCLARRRWVRNTHFLSSAVLYTTWGTGRRRWPARPRPGRVSDAPTLGRVGPARRTHHPPPTPPCRQPLAERCRREPHPFIYTQRMARSGPLGRAHTVG